MRWLLAFALVVGTPATAQDMTRDEVKALKQASKVERRMSKAYDKGQWGVALAESRERLRLMSAAFDSDAQELLGALDDVIYLESSLGEYEAQLGHAEQALAIRRSVEAPEPRGLASSLVYVGQARAKLGDIEQAVGELDSAIALFDEAGTPHDPTAATAHFELGMLAFDAQLPEVVRHHHGQVLVIAEGAGVEPIELALAAYQLGQIEQPTNPPLAISRFELAYDTLLRSFGPTDKMTWSSLQSLGEAASAAGRFDESEAHFRLAIETAPAVYGPDSPYEGQVTGQLGRVLVDTQRYEAAVELHIRAVELLEAGLGSNHPEVAYALVEAATALDLAGRPADAMMMERRALEIYETTLGPTHPNTLYTMGQVASSLSKIGQLEEAHDLAVARHERLVATVGDGHPDASDALLDIASILGDGGQTSEAYELAAHAVSEMEEAWGTTDRRLAVPLAITAEYAMDVGEHEVAMSMSSRSLRLMEESEGPKSVATSLTRASTAQILLNMGRADLAQPMAAQALADLEAIVGADSHLLLMPLAVAGVAAQRQGDIQTARAHLERAAKLAADALGPSHPQTAVAQNNYAQLLADMGDATGAVLRLRQAINTRDGLGLGMTPETGRMYLNMGSAVSSMLDDEALETFNSALLVFRAAYKDRQHADIAQALRGIGDVHLQHGRMSKALEYYEQALAEFEATLPEHHPEIATTLNNMATLAARSGETERAIKLYRRVLDMRPGQSGLHAGTMASLASLLYASDERDEARELATRAMSLHREEIGALLDLASERERRSILEGRLPILQAFLLVMDEPGDTGSRYAEVVSWKGVVGLASLLERRARTKNNDPELAPLLEELRHVRSALAKLALSGARGEDSRAGAVWLLERKEEIERELNERSVDTDLAQRLLTATPAELCKQLPAGTSVVDVFTHPVGSLSETQLNAYVLRGGDCDNVRYAPLGEVTEVASAIERWRRTITAPGVPEAAIDTVGSKTTALLWEPIAPLVGDDRIVVVPDANIVGLPWGALPVGDGKYLLEERKVAYLENVQQLLTLADAKGVERGSALVVGGVDYGDAEDAVEMSTRGGNTCSISAFSPLPATSTEADAVAGTLAKHLTVSHLSGTDATETSLAATVQGQSVVHIATHGFFVGRADGDCGGRGGSLHAGSLNPMATSGLALAGANTGGSDGTDGLWTAEEMSDLNLDGTDLVVLSACETALGHPQGAEGVLGLRRALSVAGARTSVMSLWPVEDEPTRWLMEGLYGHLYGDEPLSAADALRQAQLDLLNRSRDENGQANPRWWAAFVASGDWR